MSIEATALAKLPVWARKHIADLEKKLATAEEANACFRDGLGQPISKDAEGAMRKPRRAKLVVKQTDEAGLSVDVVTNEETE